MQMNQVYTKQVIWMAGAFLLIILVTFSNPNFFEFTGYIFYGITVLLCIAVLLVGREVSGAKSWFGFAGVGIQPSEFAKFGTALALAKFLGTYGVRFKGHLSGSHGHRAETERYRICTGFSELFPGFVSRRIAGLCVTGCRLAAGFGRPFHRIAGLSAQPGILDFATIVRHRRGVLVPVSQIQILDGPYRWSCIGLLGLHQSSIVHLQKRVVRLPARQD
jgi:hypothetical protein